jgi:hypothetical protein
MKIIKMVPYAFGYFFGLIIHGYADGKRGL